MSYSKYLFIITFLICSLISNKTNAEFHLDKYGEALEMEDLKEIYDSKFPQILRGVFNAYLKLTPNKAEDKKKLEMVEAYLPLFKEKFIVTYIRKFEDKRYCNTIPT